MLQRATATRFDRRMTSGKTWPCLLACQCRDGREIEVVAKFSAGCERGVGGLVAEAIGAMLAAVFGRLKGAWQAIPQARLEEYSSALPDEWRNDNGVAEKVIRYLTDVRTNLDAALDEVVRILQ